MLSPQIHRYLFLFGISVLGGAMLFGEVPTSIAEIILFTNWLLEGKFRQKFQQIIGSKLFLVLSSLYFLHVIGLLYTSEIARGIDDLRIKLPLLLLPLIFFTSSPLNKKELHLLLQLFVLGILLSSLWCLFYYYTHTVTDIRSASRFISHIRFGLLIDMGICILVYFIYTVDGIRRKLFYAFLIVCLLFFMIKLSLVTAIIILLMLFSLYSVVISLKQGIKTKLIVLGVFISIFSVMFIMISKEWKAFSFVDESPANTMKFFSSSGRQYFPVKETRHTENGFYTSYNIQYYELYQEWRKKSPVDLDRPNAKGNLTVWTLIRYLSSKGLTKDSVGLNQLSSDDIDNIEKGVTNYKYAEASGLRKRVRSFFWEYSDYLYDSNPSGNTMLMRFEFWKAAIYIIERNLIYGVGTGDAQKAFNKAYQRTNTNLAYEWRLRSHNQFLAITVSFGLIGAVLFLIYLIYPFVMLRKYLHPLYTAFFIIAVVSFITEDTLESQPGVTFFAYFNTLFIWLADAERKKD